jgi:D-alanyl-D-alanine carboxypeptidase (penicillin-binding protein 5/6)
MVDIISCLYYNISMKKFLLLLLIMTAVLAAFTSCHTSIPDDYGTYEAEPVLVLGDFSYVDELHSRAVFVMDIQTGETVFALNEHEKLPAASTVKIMTALLTLDLFGEGEFLDELVTVPQLVFDGFDTDDPNTVGGSMGGIQPLQTNVTHRDSLYALMLASGNEAANILAYNVGRFYNAFSSQYPPPMSNIEVFVARMNQKAREIGAFNTNFTNPHGLLEAGAYSTVYDLALIAKYAYEKYPLLEKICTAHEYVMPGNSVYPNGYRMGNSNALVRNVEGNIYYREFARGVKNGALDEYFLLDEFGDWVEYGGIVNLVSLGEKDGRAYLIATLYAPFKFGDLTDENGNRMNRLHYAYADHLKLYDWLFGG